QGSHKQPTSRDTSFSVRSRVTHRASDAVLVRAGADAALDSYEVVGVLGSLFPSRQDVALGLFADAVIRAPRGVEMTPGARVDFWGSGGVPTLSGDVRFALRVPVTSRVRLVDAVGLAHQAPSYLAPVPGVAIGRLSGGLQRSVQTSAGVEVDLPLE